VVVVVWDFDWGDEEREEEEEDGDAGEVGI
jgi:hypothetical protein